MFSFGRFDTPEFCYMFVGYFSTLIAVVLRDRDSYEVAWFPEIILGVCGTTVNLVPHSAWSCLGGTCNSRPQVPTVLGSI